MSLRLALAKKVFKSIAPNNACGGRVEFCGIFVISQSVASSFFSALKFGSCSILVLIMQAAEKSVLK